MTFEIAVFKKSNGPLSKRISLKDGKVIADGSVCKLPAGTARRVILDGVNAVAGLIGNMRSEEALTLGRLRADLPDDVCVVCKKDLNGSTPSNVIARSSEFLHYAPKQAAFMLLDHDGKGMPAEVAETFHNAVLPFVGNRAYRVHAVSTWIAYAKGGENTRDCITNPERQRCRQSPFVVAPSAGWQNRCRAAV
jgi:hypothetical protein